MEDKINILKKLIEIIHPNPISNRHGIFFNNSDVLRLDNAWEILKLSFELPNLHDYECCEIKASLSTRKIEIHLYCESYYNNSIYSSFLCSKELTEVVLEHLIQHLKSVAILCLEQKLRQEHESSFKKESEKIIQNLLEEKDVHNK